MVLGKAVAWAAAVVLIILLPREAGAQTQSPRFDISGFQVEGNSVLPAKEVEAVLAPYVGKQRDFADVQRALEALQSAYQARGYGAVHVYLPEQRLAGGAVRLNVIEGRIDKVLVTGNRHFSEANVRRALPALRENTVPNIVDIAGNSRAANENPVRQVQVVLKPGAAEGKIDAAVEVKDDKPLRPFVSVDNTGTDSTGRYRLGLGVQHANLWDRGHIATLQYITSPTETDKVSVYSLGYRFPIPSWGDSVDLYAGYSDVEAAQTETPAGPLNISGQGTIAGARYNFVLRRRGEYEHRVILGLDYRKFENQCSLGTFGAGGCAALATDPGSDVTVRPASVGYSGQWSQPARQVGFNLNVARNLPGGSNGDDAAFAAVRSAAKADYTILRYGAQAVTALLGSDWQLRAAVSGQHTGDALVPGEQFGIGGYNTVRGFFEREVLGDRGAASNLELYTPDLGRRIGWKDFSLRLLAFADAGIAYIKDPVPGQVEKEGIASWGAGLRASLRKNLLVRLDVARVVREGASQKKGEGMGHFGVVASF